MTFNLDRSSWKKMKFAEFAENVNDRVDDPKTAGVSRYVGLEHLDPGSLTVSRWGTPDQVEATKLRFKPGDVIFGRRRAYQKKVSRADFEGICSAHAMVLRAKPGVVEPDYLPVFLSSDYFLERAIKISVGSLSPTVNWKTLAAEEFELPPLDQQRRIADLLWDVEYHRRAIASLGSQVRHLDLSSVELLRMAPNVPLGSLLARIETGKSLAGTEPLSREDAPCVLKVSAVGPDGFRPEERKELLNPGGFLPASSVRAGDLLLTRSNTAEYVGRTCVAPADLPHVMLSDKILRLVPRPDGPSAAYLHWALSLPDSRRQIRSLASGTGAAMKNISQDKLRRVEIPLGSLEQQRKVLDLVEMAGATASLLDVESSALDGLRRQALRQLGGTE